MTPNYLVKLVRVAIVFIAALGVVLALGPFEVPDGPDKLVHAGCFYAFALVALAALPWHRKGDVILAVIALGGASEIAQLVCGRDGSLDDFAADAVGVVLAGAPLWIASFRHMAQRHRHRPLAELRHGDGRRRAAAAPRAVVRSGRSNA